MHHCGNKIWKQSLKGKRNEVLFEHLNISKEFNKRNVGRPHYFAGYVFNLV